MSPSSAAARAPVPAASHCWPAPPQETLLTLKGRSGSVFCGDHCYFPWVLVHTRFVCALRASLAGLRFDFKHDHVPSYCLVGASSLPLDVGHLFLVGSNRLLLMVVQQLVAIWCSPMVMYGFSNNDVWMWELNHNKGWAPKNWCFWTVVLEKTLESPLDHKEIKLVNTKWNQSWILEELMLKLQYSGYLMWRAYSL